MREKKSVRDRQTKRERHSEREREKKKKKKTHIDELGRLLVSHDRHD